MAEAGRSENKTNELKKGEPYYGERKVKIGNYRQDRRKLREMMRTKRPKTGNA